MNYEKEYKELVGKIDKAYLYAQTDSTKAVLEEIRPELREVGDEEVRKAMIDFFKHEREEVKEGIAVLHYGVNVERMIAWLEKQGEHQKFRDSIQVGDKVTRNKNGVLVNLSQLDRGAKQGEKGTNGNDREIPNSEQKPTGKVEPIEWSGKIKSRKVEGVLKKMLDEKIKSADKVEPKFREGDWITIKE